MAAVAVTFARYFREITHLPLADWFVAALTLCLLTIINCVGVKAGSAVQNVLMVIKILAIVMLVVCALWFVGMPNMSFTPALDRPVSFGLVAAFAAAMGPVMFSYGGWHTASFVAAEMRKPERDLSRGLLIGVMGVVILYVAANVVYVGALGAGGLGPGNDPGIVGDAAGTGRTRREINCRGDRHFYVGLSESEHAHCAAGLLCDGRRQALFQVGGLGWSAVARYLRISLRAHTGILTDPAALQNVRAALEGKPLPCRSLANEIAGEVGPAAISGVEDGVGSLLGVGRDAHQLPIVALTLMGTACSWPRARPKAVAAVRRHATGPRRIWASRSRRRCPASRAASPWTQKARLSSSTRRRSSRTTRKG